MSKIQYLYPKKAISYLALKTANCKTPWFKNWLIKKFITAYGVDLSTAQITDYKKFENFNAFFTRKINHKIIPQKNKILSPADGAVQNVGTLSPEELINAKNHHFKLEDLLDNAYYAEYFKGGQFCTIYLSPKDYHRVHMPLSGKLIKMHYIPGKLFSVNQKSTQAIPNIFSRNERVVCYFEADFGIFAVILVGAIIVGSISTAWHGVVNPNHSSQPFSIDYAKQNIMLNQGDELGMFSLGSTVITLLPQSAETKFSVSAGNAVQTGQII